MINYLIIALVPLVLRSQYITIGDPCKCDQLFTEFECTLKGVCEWNPIKVTCSGPDIQQIPIISTIQIRNPKSHSFSIFCDSFNQTECPLQNGCSWVSNKCVMFTGCTAHTKYSDEDCKQISNKCITDGVRCVELGECESYIYIVACKISKSGEYCVWNPYERSCSKAQECSDLPQTLQNDIECRQQISYCTAKENGGCYYSGQNCKDQSYKSACVTDRYQTINCIWIENKCQDLICENAPQSYKTDEECRNFLSTCTTQQDGGCILRTSCNEATVEQACITDSLGIECIWNGEKCNEKKCENAPPTYTTNEQCQSIEDNCISSGRGCLINYGCWSAFEEGQCKQDPNGNQCIWTGFYCKLKKCDEADQAYTTDGQCSQYMSNCISKINGQPGCQEKTCDTAPQYYTTNQQCQQYLQNCITKLSGGCKYNTMCFSIDSEKACIHDKDGNKCYWNNQDSKCYQITSCLQIKNKDYCIKDVDDEECQWLEPKFNKLNGYCVKKQCNTAPLHYTTKEQCQDYFENCIPNKFGGCKSKQQCSDSDFANSCTTDEESNACIWDQGQCRNLQCSDLQGVTFLQCNSQLNTCTTGFYEQCAPLLSCEEYIYMSQCIKGLNGQCLWIDNYKNQDNSLGGCFQFDKCQSLKWKTDAECKMASSSCTTDGKQCVPITLCQTTNTNGGCIMGTDGECIQSVPALNSNSPKTCQRLENCGTAYYLTHEECQEANRFCTTNGDSSCRDLTACPYYYNIHSCNINNIGVVKDENDRVLSTGICKWNTESDLCRDLICTDLIFTTEQQCQSQLYNCTSDGQRCVEKLSCQQYLESNICTSRSGSNGQCFWEVENQICRLKECSEIMNGITQNICNEVKNCVSDGKNCLKKSKCKEYQNQLSCSQFGLDGICFWQENTCSLMINCNTADQHACHLANDRCYWNQTKCIEHTCETFFYQENQCFYFLTWDMSKYTICKMIQGTCQAIDAKTLTQEECYDYSLYIYSWNPISNKCVQCSKQIKNTRNQTKNQFNEQYTDYQYILSIIAIIYTLT